MPCACCIALLSQYESATVELEKIQTAIDKALGFRNKELRRRLKLEAVSALRKHRKAWLALAEHRENVHQAPPLTDSRVATFD